MSNILSVFSEEELRLKLFYLGIEISSDMSACVQNKSDDGFIPQLDRLQSEVDKHKKQLQRIDEFLDSVRKHVIESDKTGPGYDIVNVVGTRTGSEYESD